jgi:hypothetical protein
VEDASESSPPPSHAPLQAQSTNFLNRPRMCTKYAYFYPMIRQHKCIWRGCYMFHLQTTKHILMRFAISCPKYNHHNLNSCLYQSNINPTERRNEIELFSEMSHPTKKKSTYTPVRYVTFIHSILQCSK